jgi:hypothetical protein
VLRALWGYQALSKGDMEEGSHFHTSCRPDSLDLFIYASFKSAASNSFHFFLLRWKKGWILSLSFQFVFTLYIIDAACNGHCGTAVSHYRQSLTPDRVIIDFAVWLENHQFINVRRRCLKQLLNKRVQTKHATFLKLFSYCKMRHLVSH